MSERRGARAYIKRAIAAVDAEMAERAASVDGPMSREQLSRIRKCLLEMLESVEAQRFSGTLLGTGKMIVDSWPLNAELGEIILAAEQAYRNWGATAESEH